MNALLEDLARIVGETGVLSGTQELAPFVTDVRGCYTGNARCVVRPRSVEEVAAVVACCVERSVPIQPQGGNTSLCGGSVPLAGERGVILSLSRLRRIREINAANNSIGGRTFPDALGQAGARPARAVQPGQSHPAINPALVCKGERKP
ncbi:MAG: FAD-binding oxidoreductase [Burkholderiales bacterium]